MTVLRALAPAAALALVACAAQPPADAAPPVQGQAPGKTCDGSNIQQFVGQQRSPELEAEMIRVSGAAIVRWAPFGTAVTMEFRPDRLTVFLDANNRVERISCS